MADDGRQGSAVENIRARVQEKAERRAAQRAAEARVAGNGEGSGASSSAVVRGERREAARPAPEVPDSQEMPGIDADRPTDIPKRGWLQIVKRSWAENNADNMPIIAGGVAFFAFLSIFPALIATISIYGLVASPEQVTQQIESLSDQLPESAQDILTEQLTDITSNAGGALTFGLIASVLGALWTASGGVNNMVKAVNIAYDEVETRNFLKLRALSLVLTLGAIVFILITFALIAVVPVVLDVLPLGGVGTVLAQVLRWVLLLAVVVGSLAVLYRVAPDRDAPKIRWVSLGSLVVTVIWAVVSVAFSFYVNNFGSYNETYGAIAGVIVLMLWLYLTCYLVLLGAEINAETEHQTARDTTQGDPEPMGKRDAVVADEMPDPPVPAK
ncbi:MULTISPECIES: YihY/virulence factor BrkB family protein [unclassified Modestobacter]|uniref:YihY/virulence factor BrkB family protein n=1 Tax=unclassified Modestobacter TaxID=2643866 RepID=UPI0022AAE828|nr:MULTISPECIES: YihY/virulence factor BrkB family protein [unclassified Modestobacter]MCZ2824745.1 YihY/virulence factor BrkB family protein [Modestobacter sp. VKM Ac-2981]MCZ2854752.1 YihY/virulence factor BrkB family protein [Modestobacter sp. VKM Ac-2982]